MTIPSTTTIHLEALDQVSRTQYRISSASLGTPSGEWPEFIRVMGPLDHPRFSFVKPTRLPSPPDVVVYTCGSVELFVVTPSASEAYIEYLRNKTFDPRD